MGKQVIETVYQIDTRTGEVVGKLWIGQGHHLERMYKSFVRAKKSRKTRIVDNINMIHLPDKMSVLKLSINNELSLVDPSDMLVLIMSGAIV